jgi:hypothetical protein
MTRVNRRRDIYDRRGWSKHAESEPEDARQGTWSREQLIKMDQRYHEAMLREREERPHQIGPPRRAGAA